MPVIFGNRSAPTSAAPPRSLAADKQPVEGAALAGAIAARESAFAKERNAVIIAMKKSLAAKNYDSVLKLGDPYFDVKDSEFRSLYDTASKGVETETAKKAASLRKREGVRVGMTKADVLASSWGRPQHVNTTTTSAGTTEQWVYGIGNYLYFTDGILTAVQN